MKKKEKKTNAMRFLDTYKIPYEVLEYDYEDMRGTGLHMAEELHLDPRTVFKTLVGNGDKTGPVVFCIPVAEELDLKQAARVSMNKSVTLIHVKDLLGITGYMRGGCSPIGMKKKFPTFFDETMELFPQVSISAGMRGMQVRVEPQSLKTVIEAELAPLTQEHVTK